MTTTNDGFSKSENFQSTMSSLNYGHVMERAARDYQKEILEKEDIDKDDLLSRRRRNNTINLNNEEEEMDEDSVQQEMKEKRLEELKNGTRKTTCNIRDCSFFTLRCFALLYFTHDYYYYYYYYHYYYYYNIKKQNKSSGSRWNG